jgi:putative NIF3 family GTP cyclohydrolase 1 type 2
MNISQCKNYLFELFSLTSEIPEEFGFTSEVCDEIKTIGYATNLTPEIVRNSIKRQVDLIVTHHDAWDFLYGMKERCLEEMRLHNISHVFSHTPLDVAEFGTVNALTKKLGAELAEDIYIQGKPIGKFGKYRKPLKFSQLVDRLEHLCSEHVASWQNHNRLVRKICVLPGGAIMTEYVRAAVEQQCDAYITGEKALYTVEYAKFARIDLIVGSHTFTEIFAVRNLAELIRSRFNEVNVVRIHEPHIEVIR